MPVASAYEAAMAPPAQIIGHIHTTIGCGTLTRGHGVARQVVAGAPVLQDDVIETDADGQIGLLLIDGTLFNISCGTRVVLSEFVFDVEGMSHTALFDVTRGSFSFVAGPLAKAGSVGVNTPVASIRARSHAGGFGMLTLAALTFSVMKNAEAADPNVTFLDDDAITYKDLAHGAFELVTKETIPRHIIVEDPGETIVLNKAGSAISVNKIANTAARMEELQAAQQEVLANLAQGRGPHGSSTPPFVESESPQPINFVPPDEPALQDLLQPVSSFVVFVPAPLIVRSPPTLSIGAGLTEHDTVVFDTFTATSGTFAASSTNSDVTLTFGVIGASVGNTVVDGVTYDLSKTDPYGTLHVNSTSGAYTFVPNSAAINALTAPTTDNFVVTVSDGFTSVNQTFTITINGVNDAAFISGTTTGSTVEAGGIANGTPGTSIATGTLTDTDVDNPPNTFAAVSSPKASAGGYGTFMMTAAGVWTYTLDNANVAVQALKACDTLIDSFTVTSIDGTTQVVTITIHGAGDDAIISGMTTGSVIEAGGVANACPGTPTATGTLTFTDVDTPSNAFTAVCSPTASDNGYGTFSMTAAGVWTYTLDNTDCTVQALNAAQTLTDTFTVTTLDGTAQVVTITIHGTNDAAIICGTTTGAVTEAGTAAPGIPTATGTLTDTDVDNTPNSFTAVCSPTASDNGYGTFTMTAAGVWTYTLDNNNCVVQALDVCDTLTDTFTVTAIDGTTQAVNITIHGARDADPKDFDCLATGSVAAAAPVLAAGSGPFDLGLHHAAAPAETIFVFDHLTVPGSTDTTMTGKNDVMAGSGQMPDIAFAAPSFAHGAAEQHASHESKLRSGDGDHSASAPEHADNAAHAHGRAGSDGADPTLNPSLLKSSTGGGPNHSLSSEAAGQHDAPRHDAVDINPPSAGDAAPGSAPAASHQFDDSFHFKDDALPGRGSQLSAELAHPSDPSGHREHAGGVHGSEAAPMPELSPSYVDAVHGAGTIGAHVLHDLIV